MVTTIQACPHVVFRKLPNTDFLRFFFYMVNSTDLFKKGPFKKQMV